MRTTLLLRRSRASSSHTRNHFSASMKASPRAIGRRSDPTAQQPGFKSLKATPRVYSRPGRLSGSYRVRVSLNTTRY
ncbi:unnamed protein product [Protopolystoma xenopodis]|uniref:Uncharacterized protein n=1 Tax=Protopolystoma xenopodis TaxID=117903 RepID=A0A448X1C7_9PLAT|nr:unnamed protein product [Protopolystoma xenopodis]